MTDLHTAAKLALEALNTTESDCGSRAWEREQEAITALRQALEQQPAVQVSPLEFVSMVIEKEHLVGKPLFWAEWPNKENT